MNRLWRCSVVVLVCVSMSACASMNGYGEHEYQIEREKPPEAIWLGEQPPTERETEPRQEQQPEDVAEGTRHEEAFAFWDQFTGVWMADFSSHAELPDAEAYAYVLAGLAHADPGIRWYCAYRLLDWLPQLERSDLEQALLPLLLDEQSFVQQAAGFVLDVAAGRLTAHEYDWVATSPDGLMHAFYRYANSRYNDWLVYIWSEDAGLRTFAVDGSVTGLTWSPNGKLLGVAYGGRIWGNVSVYDVAGDAGATRLSMPNFAHVLANGEQYGYGIDPDEVTRFDPYVAIIEWSPDSSSFLFSYEFSDQHFMTFYGYGVYSVTEQRIQHVYPLVPDGEDSKPDWLDN